MEVPLKMILTAFSETASLNDFVSDKKKKKSLQKLFLAKP